MHTVRRKVEARHPLDVHAVRFEIESYLFDLFDVPEQYV